MSQLRSREQLKPAVFEHGTRCDDARRSPGRAVPIATARPLVLITGRVHGRFVLALLCAVMLLAPRARAADTVVPGPTDLPQTLTLERALQIFRTSGLDLLIADANMRSAEGALKIAGAIPNPVLSGSVGNAFTYSAGVPGRAARAAIQGCR